MDFSVLMNKIQRSLDAANWVNNKATTIYAAAPSKNNTRFR